MARLSETERRSAWRERKRRHYARVKAERMAVLAAHVETLPEADVDRLLHVLGDDE